MDLKRVKIFSGARHLRLAKRVCDYLGLPLGKASIGYHIDGDDDPVIDESVRGCICIVIQSTVKPAALAWMQLLLIVDALRRAHAREIIVIIPNFGYARAERKEDKRTSISAALVAQFLQVAGATRVVLLDPHADAIQGFFDHIWVEKLTAFPLFTAVILRENDGKRIVCGGPDLNAAKMYALPMSRPLHATISAIAKMRFGDVIVQALAVLGDVMDARVEGGDDLFTTGTTVENACDEWIARGAADIRFNITHAMMVGNYLQKLAAAKLSRVRVTNSTPLPATLTEAVMDKLEVIDIAPLIGDAIKVIIDDSPENPMHKLFEMETWMSNGQVDRLVLPRADWAIESAEETEFLNLLLNIAEKNKTLMKALTA